MALERPGIPTVAALILAALAPIAIAPSASAQPSVPQQNSPCSENWAGALTQLPDLQTVLECRGQPGGGYQWQLYDSPYPNSDRWLSYGPALTLHGEGQRNREINPGDWIGYPQDSDTQCKATQVAVVTAGELTPPQVSAGEPGQTLRFQTLPLLFTIELSRYCLWQKAG